MLTSDYISQIRELVHDLQSVDWTDTELITIVNNARQRAALDLHCVRTLYTGLTTIPNQEVYPINGGVGSITLLSGGSGYTFGAAVNITPNPRPAARLRLRRPTSAAAWSQVSIS